MNNRTMFRMLVGGLNGSEVGYIGFDERETTRWLPRHRN